MRITSDGWLEATASGLPAITRVPSPRATTLEADLKWPIGVVWHWTGGPARGPGFAPALAEEIRTYNKATDRAASWHVLVAKDGRIFQSVQFNRGSWHAGRPARIGGKPVKEGSSWNALAWPGRLFANVNRCTAGIELENSGRLEQRDGKFFCWPFDAHNEIPAERAVKHGDLYFDDFPLAQEMAATRLLQAMALTFKLTRDASQYGHMMIDPARKEDPGPLWQEVILPRILDRVFGAE